MSPAAPRPVTLVIHDTTVVTVDPSGGSLNPPIDKQTFKDRLKLMIRMSDNNAAGSIAHEFDTWDLDRADAPEDFGSSETPLANDQAEIDAMAHPAVVADANGAGTIEAYTVVHGRGADSEQAPVGDTEHPDAVAVQVLTFEQLIEHG